MENNEGLVLVLFCIFYNFEGIESFEKEFSCNIFYSYRFVLSKDGI